MAAIVFKDEKILIAKRLPGGNVGGLWEFPGGKVESNETEETALQREILEEFGLSIQIKEKVKSAMDFSVPIEIHFYLCQTSLEPQFLTEHEAWKWEERSQLLNYQWTPLDVELATELAQGKF